VKDPIDDQLVVASTLLAPAAVIIDGSRIGLADNYAVFDSDTAAPLELCKSPHSGLHDE